MSNSNVKINLGWLGILPVMTLIFTALKLMGLVSLTWFQVFIPILLGLGIGVGAIVLGLILWLIGVTLTRTGGRITTTKNKKDN